MVLSLHFFDLPDKQDASDCSLPLGKLLVNLFLSKKEPVKKNPPKPFVPAGVAI